MTLLTHIQQVNALLRVAEDLAGTPGDDFDACARLFHTRLLEKGEHFVHAGRGTDRVALVVSGIARLYYTREDGKEFNKGFVAAPDFMAALDALITSEPPRLAIQALTPMQLFVAPYAELVAFFSRSVYWQRLQRRIVERVYVKKVKREASLLMDSAQQRYQTFLAEYPTVDDVVPDYHVAAYLGITAEALSRLKRGDKKG